MKLSFPLAPRILYFELNSMKMITSPMINPLAPLWSVYLNPIESNISPMISLFQKMKVNISPNLWTCTPLINPSSFHMNTPYDLSKPSLWLGFIKFK